MERMATILQYMGAAMRRAEYERLEDGNWFAHIAGFKGLWASGPTIEEARADLYEALDGWLTVNYLITQNPPPDIGTPFGVEKIAE